MLRLIFNFVRNKIQKCYVTNCTLSCTKMKNTLYLIENFLKTPYTTY